MFDNSRRFTPSAFSVSGKVIAGLIMDYFDCMGLDFSRTVFEPETGYVSCHLENFPKQKT